MIKWLPPRTGGSGTGDYLTPLDVGAKLEGAGRNTMAKREQRTGRGKRYDDAAARIETQELHSGTDALEMVRSVYGSKFDESIDLVVRLGVDPRKTEEMVRGTVALPSGTGKDVRVAVFAQGEAASSAREAGADHVGADDLATEVEGGMLDFDVAIATPDMMATVGKLGRALGPRGLMPNPKSGTVTDDVAKAVAEFKGGKVEFRADKHGNVHLPIGRVSFEVSALQANMKAAIEELERLRPASTKGRYLRKVSVSSTMGPGVRIDPLRVVDWNPLERRRWVAEPAAVPWPPQLTRSPKTSGLCGHAAQNAPTGRPSRRVSWSAPGYVWTGSSVYVRHSRLKTYMGGRGNRQPLTRGNPGGRSVENPRPDKVAVVDEVRERLSNTEAAVLTEYRGLDVPALAELRAALRAAGGDYKVYKNTLVRLAVSELDLEIDDLLTGPTAIALVADRPDGSPGDAVSMAKALDSFAKEHEALVIKGGLLDSQRLSIEQVLALAKIAPREVLLAQLAGAMAAPIQQFAGLLNALPQNLAYALKALIDQHGGPASLAEDDASDEAPVDETDVDAVVDEASADDNEAPAEEAEADTETAAADDNEAPAEEAEAETAAADDNEAPAEEAEADTETAAADDTEEA